MKPSRIVKSAHKGRPQPLKAFVRENINNSDQRLADACKAWLKAKGLSTEGTAK